MLDSWNMDGEGQKIQPWSQDEFFGEVRKLSGIAPKIKDSIKARGLLISRTESSQAEHALGSYGVEYTVEDVDRDTLRIVSQNLVQAAGMLRHAKVSFKEDMPEAAPQAQEPPRGERDEMEILHVMGQVVDLAKTMGLNQSLQTQLETCLADIHAELKGRHVGKSVS